MHFEARDYVRRYSTLSPMSIVEIGSRNVNGAVRDLFSQQDYTGIDIRPGRGVDIVVNAIDWNPPSLVDFVICTEVLEHCEHWHRLVLHACTWLKFGGRIIVTCAGPGREPHSAVDGRALQKGEWYANISPRDIALALREAGVFADSLEYVASSHDTRASAEFIPDQP